MLSDNELKTLASIEEQMDPKFVQMFKNPDLQLVSSTRRSVAAALTIISVIFAIAALVVGMPVLSLFFAVAAWCSSRKLDHES